MNEIIDGKHLEAYCNDEKSTNDFKIKKRHYVDSNLKKCLTRVNLVSKIKECEYLVYISIEPNSKHEKLIELAGKAYTENLRTILMHFSADNNPLNMPYGKCCYFDVVTIQNENGKKVDVVYIEKRKQIKSSLHYHTINSLSEVMSLIHRIARMCKRSYTLSQANANKVIDNFKHISNYANQQFIASRELYYKYIKEDFGKYFEHSERVLSQLKALTGSLTDIKDLFPSRYFVELPIVLNHGFLTSELVKVSPTGGIREINDWHNVSLLPIGYDVFSLMVNSFDTNLRRDHFEKVLAYFHSCFRGNALLEFKLSLLIKYYKKSIAYIAVKNFPRMLLKLKAKNVSSSTKKMMARRWEAALDDAYMIAIDNDI